jgi:hypothetical protein
VQLANSRTHVQNTRNYKFRVFEEMQDSRAKDPSAETNRTATGPRRPNGSEMNHRAGGGRP